MLLKSITERTRLTNTFLKNRTVGKKLAYAKQRNFCVLLLRKVKRECFTNLNKKNITGNRTFWQTVKPFLSEKNKSKEKTILVKNEEIVCDNVDVANILNNYFWNVVKNLKIYLVFPDTQH